MATTTDLGKVVITNGGEYNPDAVYEEKTFVLHNNSTYISLKTVTGVEPVDDKVNWQLMAQGFDATALSSVTATDTSGVLGTAGSTVSAQDLVDWIADQALTKLIRKVDMSGVQVDDATKVPTSALAYQMQQAITENANAITALNGDRLWKFSFMGELYVPNGTQSEYNVDVGIYILFTRHSGALALYGMFFINISNYEQTSISIPLYSTERFKNNFIISIDYNINPKKIKISNNDAADLDCFLYKFV